MYSIPPENGGIELKIMSDVGCGFFSFHLRSISCSLIFSSILQIQHGILNYAFRGCREVLNIGMNKWLLLGAHVVKLN